MRFSLRIDSERARRTLPCAALLLALTAGCDQQLMRTPNLYTDGNADPWADVPQPLRTPDVEVLYATDRGREPGRSAAVRYGSHRSRSLAYGVCTVALGDGLTWDQLHEQSRLRNRTRSVPVRLSSIREIGRFTETPIRIVSDAGGIPQPDPEDLEHDAIRRSELQQLVAERLALTPRKDAFVFIHGFNYSFEDSALLMAELWHFLGRAGVPIAYSWPAGSGLNVRGYNYDLESGEFTVFHLKAFLEMLAETPGLEHVHLIAHSRGTDVLASALRELNIKYTERNPDIYDAAACALHIGHVVLAAPDIDLDVAQQRLAAERVGRAFKQLTVYTSPDDLALAFAKWLFSSVVRLGTLGLANLPDVDRGSLARIRGFSVIDARVSSDWIGHTYFYSNPAVSSDLILLLRDGCAPGKDARSGLIHSEGAFWEIHDGYPTR